MRSEAYYAVVNFRANFRRLRTASITLAMKRQASFVFLSSMLGSFGQQQLLASIHDWRFLMAEAKEKKKQKKLKNKQKAMEDEQKMAEKAIQKANKEKINAVMQLEEAKNAETLVALNAEKKVRALQKLCVLIGVFHASSQVRIVAGWRDHQLDAAI